MIRLQHIHHFLAVTDAGTLRAAAGRLGLTQPAITKSLRQLESHLGLRLVLRTPKGIVLTPEGRTFLARARVVQAELRRLEEELGAGRGTGASSVAIGVAPPFSLAMPDAMARFRAHHPATRVRIVEGVRTALLPSVRDEVLDFATGQNVGGREQAGLRFRPVLRPRLAVAGRRDHPRRAARTLRELADCEWIVFNPPGAGGIVEEMFAAAELPLPRALVQCESFATALALAARSDALILLFEQLLTQPLAARYLQPIGIREAVPSPSLGIFHRVDTPFTPAAATMAAALTAALRQWAGR